VICTRRWRARRRSHLGRCGRLDARRRRHTAQRGGGVQRCYPGERLQATRGAGSSSSDTGELLTCLRNSGTAPRRRRGGDGREQRRRRGLGFRRARRGCTGRRLGFLVSQLRGGGALNRPGNRPRRAGQARTARSDSGSSPARRRRDGGDDRRAAPVSRCKRAGAEMGRRQLDGLAGPGCGAGLHRRKKTGCGAVGCCWAIWAEKEEGPRVEALLF
jgi:hypothetical protein